MTRPFSITLLVKDEVDFLKKSLPACQALLPDETIVCTNKPSYNEIRKVVQKTSAKLLEVKSNPEWKWHQAWVRRVGFLSAQHDTILTVDVDLIVNGNCLKAVDLVGRNGTALVSMSKFYRITSPASLWRNTAYHLIRQFYHGRFSGLYALWRPAWLESEDLERAKELKNPKLFASQGLGEDTFLQGCIAKKYKVLSLRDIGAICTTSQQEDDWGYQFELGRGRAHKEGPLKTLVHSITYLRPNVFNGFVHERRK